MSLQKYHHVPVLQQEVLEHLKLKSNKNYIDCTLGGGGHTVEILKAIQPKGKVLGIDLDAHSLEAATQRAKKERLAKNLLTKKQNFKKLKQITYDMGFSKIDGILLDLGISSGQLSNPKRGFSFLAEGKLDMRFAGESSNELTAYHIINKLSLDELIKIFKNYGEEPLSAEIARKIVTTRKIKPIQYPQQLVEIVRIIYQKHYKKKSKVNPATRIFQAIRITVNDEIENLKQVLPQAVEILNKSGRLVVISYHSLEDRIVKEFFKTESRGCICPPQRPTCRCEHKKTLKIITKKPIIPTDKEMIENPRSRSAKLRVAERL
ncbi:16S rRNA (cytosine(1402)-N(4))-methyltransferase RsmH [Patescibacteria group bacterium]|nr:16S rRNA (cytosine(1402)-N(4))-methyltransferase RsmH [Patescibacteria group bacterium]